jgi:DNA repair exonuclease SbcCD ATPase subunit
MQRQVIEARASMKEQEKQISATYTQAISSSVVPHQDGQDSAAYIESLTPAHADLAELSKKAQADLAKFQSLGQEAIRQCEERIRSAEAEKRAAEEALRKAAAEMEGAKKRKAEIEAESGMALGFALCEKYGCAGGGRRRRID